MDPMGRILGISLLLEADANENFVSLVRPDLYRVRECDDLTMRAIVLVCNET